MYKRQGNLYLCDSRLKRIYRWDPESQRLTLLTSLHFRPLSLACDTQGRLLVVTEYKPVKGSVVNGREELSTDEFEGRDGGGCYYPFFSMDRRVRVAVMDPDYPEDSLAVLPVVPIEDVYKRQPGGRPKQCDQEHGLSSLGGHGAANGLFS